MPKFTDDTQLAALGLPHLDLILDELFLIPPPALRSPTYVAPCTIGELAGRSGITTVEVLSRLEKVRTMSESLEIDSTELEELLASADPASRPVLVDVREQWEYDICHLPGSILLSREHFATLLESLRAAPLVVTVCHHGVRSFSAALYLKQHGVKNVRSLSGGVEAWALDVDPKMARY